MRKQRPKMSDMVPHPLPGYAKFGRMVSRREALDFQKQQEALARVAEQRKAADQLIPRLKEINGWEREVAGIADDLKVTPAAIMLAFQKYDARVVAAKVWLFPCIGLEGTSEVHGYDRKTGEPYTKKIAYELSDEDKVQAMVEHVLTFCEIPKKVKTARYRRSKEAMRKAKARAEGRVKPRPRKGPPSIPARIAAAEKSLITRRATLERLKADPKALQASVRRCEVGIERAEKALTTWKARLSSHT